MKILLTGAAGLVGSHLAERLVKDGHEVTGVDNLCTGRKQNLDSVVAAASAGGAGAGSPARAGKFTFIEADVVQPLPSSITSQKWDWVMHFASPASPPKYVALAVETLRVNSEGTRNLLELCRASEAGSTGGTGANSTSAKFFYASTSEVYGDPLVHPQPESYWGNVNSIGPRSMYDEAKRFGEALTYAYQRQHKVDVRVIRIFNTYGPKMDPDDGRVVTNLMMQALAQKPMTIYGDGKQTRSFQFVSDLVEGIVRLMNSSYTQPVNLGNPQEFTILEFAEKVKALTGTKSEFKFVPLPGDDPKQRKPDITTARRELQWEPKIQLDQGLALTLPYFKNA